MTTKTYRQTLLPWINALDQKSKGYNIGHKTYLEHGGESGTAGNHSDLTAQVGRVVKLSLGSTSIDGVANNELREHLGNVSLRVSLMLEIMLWLAAI